MWKEDVRQNWAKINLERFCVQIGVDFASAFEGSLDLCHAPLNPYPQYNWVITENLRIPSGVLHLVPPQVGTDPTLWEEWFAIEGHLHHHVLRNHPHEPATDIWQGDLSDSEHPREVLGFQWHHFNDLDLRPMRYRESHSSTR